MTGPIKVSRSIKELLTHINQIKEDYLKNTGEEISIDDIAKKLKLTKEEVAFAIESRNPIGSIDEEIYEDKSNSETKINQIKDNKDETNKLLNKICISQLIKELEKREQEIIILRYYQNKTQLEVAKKLGISQVQVSRIEKKILLAMRNKIEA